MDAQNLEVLNKKILVIQTAFLGDAVLTLPLIQKLKEKKEDVKITVLCIPSTKEVFRYSSSVEKVIIYDKRGADKSIFSYIRIINKIRSEKFDLVISPHRSIRSTLISFFSGAKNTYGYNTADFSFLFKNRIEYRKDQHEVQRNLSFLESYNKLDTWKVLPELAVTSNIKDKIDKLVDSFSDKKIVAIAPGSVWKTKVYPSEYFQQLISLIHSSDYLCVLIGGAEDKNLCETIAKSNNQIISLAGQLSIIESVEFLKRCTAIVCNDSAPTHLAMAANIPALTIYCSTIPGFGFYPYNETSKYVSYNELACKPCGIHGFQNCKIKTFACAYNLQPEMVFEKLKQILPA